MELIGRERELTELTERLAGHRLVTVIGPGGIGKTALARAAAERLGPGYELGVHVIDLTRVDAAEAVGGTIAAQLAFPSFAALLASPTEQPALLVVDNCEHVIEAAAGAIGDLLDACASPTVLATSRSPLDLPSESVVSLGPLATPRLGLVEAGAPSIVLFNERARDAGADVGADQLDVVADLCRALDGIPLALEIAAARTRAMSPAEILARLGDLDTLNRPRFRGSERHRSLRSTIEWSYRLLDAEDRRFFDHLSVLAGQFTAGTAHAVGGDEGASVTSSLDRIDRLVAASLLVAEPEGRITRYRQLAALRTFASERLVADGAWDDTWNRLVDHVVAEVLDVVAVARDRWDASLLSRLLILYDSIVAALQWCLERDDEPDRTMLLIATLWGVVHQGHAEDVAGVVERALTRWPDPSAPAHADAVATIATCRYLLGEPRAAIELAEAALPHTQRSLSAPCTLRRVIAQSRAALGDVDSAIAALDDAIEEARRLGLTPLAMEMTGFRAELSADLGAIDEALADVRDVQAEARRAGSDINAVWARCVEGSILLRVDESAAEAATADALTRARALDYPACVSVCLHCHAELAVRRGDLDLAARLVIELLEGLVARGAHSELRNALRMSAVLLHAADRPGWADLAATAASLPVVSIFATPGHERPPLPPHQGRPLSCRDAVLLARDELAALSQATPRPHAVEPDRGGDEPGVFRRVGEFWEVAFAGRTVNMRQSKGMDDIAMLLARPGTEVHCVDLAGVAVEQSSTGDVIDATARRRYEDRIRELQADIDEAEANNDHVRSERAQSEFDAIVDQLTSAVGLAGKARRGSSSVERARMAVTQRVRTTIKRIAKELPELSRHLDASIRTGTYCSYRPQRETSWMT